MSVEVEVGGVYEQASDLTPAGTIVAFGGTVAPSGWYLCDGSVKSRTTDQRLYDVIGINFGDGDGNTTFNLPDLRGQFLRGLDTRTTESLDPDAAYRKNLHDSEETLGAVVGSYQDDAIRNITGSYLGRGSDTGIGGYNPTVSGALKRGTNCSRYTEPVANNDSYGIELDASLAVPTGNDNRPKNIAVNYIIKN